MDKLHSIKILLKYTVTLKGSESFLRFSLSSLTGEVSNFRLRLRIYMKDGLKSRIRTQQQVLYHKNEIRPLRKSKEKRKHIVNLLFMAKEKQKHYCLIKKKNMSGLLSMEVLNHKESKEICLSCLSHVFSNS